MWSDRLSRQVLIGAILAMTVGYGAIAWIPSYLVRSHGLNIAQAGAYLAVVIGLGGALGSWLGGRLSDRLGRRDPRWSLWVVVIVFVVARPFAMAFYWVDDTTLALSLFVLPAAVGAIHIGPSVAVLHERIEPHLRPLASALFLMILTLVGLGLGPLAVGAMSQFAFAGYGEDSLRYALADLAMRRAVGGGALLLGGPAARGGCRSRKCHPRPRSGSGMTLALFNLHSRIGSASGTCRGIARARRQAGA